MTMNASQLQAWVLSTLRPQITAANGLSSSLCGGETREQQLEFWNESGRHRGLLEAERLLLDLIVSMQDQERIEREARWAAEDAAEAVTPPAENVTHA